MLFMLPLDKGEKAWFLDVVQKSNSTKTTKEATEMPMTKPNRMLSLLSCCWLSSSDMPSSSRPLLPESRDIDSGDIVKILPSDDGDIDKELVVCAGVGIDVGSLVGGKVSGVLG